MLDVFDADPREIRPRWHRDALCIEHPEVNWFPTTGQPTAPAKAICSRCAVATECRTYALGFSVNELFGVWGGLSAKERQQVRLVSRTSGQTAAA